ncbi:unnamed protein product [Bursaphelenchus okinawaensis]|uniref:Uncharacterized protein n=1 Tax=Bursaphelenchus okinawaensis TaxID=465554 RepID=A0A811L6Z3_9BILA|nr:unnamed protein product [Bursaphelenchus okinawaensis]CAG9119048.1 unnamed protein product [Bursaphelenchus okinawaensis]
MILIYYPEVYYAIGVGIVVYIFLIWRGNGIRFPEPKYLQDMDHFPEKKSKRCYVRRKPTENNIKDQFKQPLAPKMSGKPEVLYAEPPTIGHFNPRPLTPSRAVTMQTQTTPLHQSRKPTAEMNVNYGLRSRNVQVPKSRFPDVEEEALVYEEP